MHVCTKVHIKYAYPYTYAACCSLQWNMPYTLLTYLGYICYCMYIHEPQDPTG